MFYLRHFLALIIISQTNDIIFIRRRIWVNVLPNFGHNHMSFVKANQTMALAFTELNNGTGWGGNRVTFIIRVTFVICTIG